MTESKEGQQSPGGTTREAHSKDASPNPRTPDTAEREKRLDQIREREKQRRKERKIGIHKKH